MLTRRRYGFFNLFARLWRPLASLLLLDIAVTIGYVGLGWRWLAPLSMPLPLISTGLAVFLAFRNNTAYGRWWEARTLWGAVVNESRNFSRALNTYFAAAEYADLRTELTSLQIAWVHALRCLLRGQDCSRTLKRLLEPEDFAVLGVSRNYAFAIQTLMGQRLAQAHAQRHIDIIALTAFNNTLNELTNAQGGLERIKNTPMPRQFSVFPKMFVSIYCLMLPLGIVPDLGWYTPLGSTLIGFLFLALESAGRELEDPFARTIHDVPMTAITRTIEINLLEAIDAPHMPPPPKALMGILR